MSKLGLMLLVWAICECVSAAYKEKDSFVQPLDYSSLFEGPASLASSPLASAMLNLEKSQYPQLFDTVVSSSIDSIQSRVAPNDHTFSAESFGFNPIASQGFQHPVKSAKSANRPRPQPHSLPLQQRPHLASPLQYNIQTVHDPYYKVYKPEADEQQQQQQQQPDILESLKNNPSVAGYFRPASTNIKVAHPLKYRKEEATENTEDDDENYKPNAYITGGSRIRRYTDGRKRDSHRTSSHEEEEEEDPYHYKAEYISKPKAFDGPAYNSAYKEDKDPNKDYEYPYGSYDSGYDHKEYERIKQLSEQQAAEIKQNPGNCKEVLKDGMKCVTCKDPKTGGNYESCSYVTEPKNNKYAYSKERKFDSNDEPDEPEVEQKDDTSAKPAKYEAEKDDEDSPKQYAKLTSSSEPSGKEYSGEADGSGDKYKGYYVHSSRPKTSAALRAAHDGEGSEEEKTDSLSKPYNYKQALPGFYTENEPKKDVEHVLAEFKKKDRSSCKQVQKNGMTCFQCIDKSGLKNEECMFVSESAPQRSHLAYQELKEFTSKPATINGKAEEAESQTVTTSAPAPAQKSAAYVVATTGYGKKLKRKKAPQGTLATAATNTVTAATLANPTQQPTRSRKVKRSEQSEVETAAEIVDETNIAAPEEFAGADSKGAFWAETQPRYSASLGVTLPEFMLARSEHEAYFDETVASA